MDECTRDIAILHSVLAISEDAIIVSDAKGVITQNNPVAERMFGYEPDEMIGQNVSILMPKALAERHDGFMRRYLSLKKERIIGTGRDVEGQRKDQSVFPVHVSIGAAEIDEEHYFIGILHDLTRRQALQDALSRS